MGVVSTVKTIGLNGAFGDVINVWGFTSDYKNAREQGNSKAVSVAKGATSFAFNEMLFGGVGAAIETAGLTGGAAFAANVGFMAAFIGVTAGAQLATASATHTTQTMTNAYNSKGKFGSGHFNMTNAGYTMRQRSLNAIHSNGLNTQSVLGNEARTYFRSSL